MATVLVELSPAVYERLQQRAAQAGKSPEQLSQDLLEGALVASARLSDQSELKPTASAEPDVLLRPRTTRENLQTSGLFTEPSPALKSRITLCVTLEEVQDAPTAAGGPSPSAIIDEQRGRVEMRPRAADRA